METNNSRNKTKIKIVVLLGIIVVLVGLIVGGSVVLYNRAQDQENEKNTDKQQEQLDKEKDADQGRENEKETNETSAKESSATIEETVAEQVEAAETESATEESKVQETDTNPVDVKTWASAYETYLKRMGSDVSSNYQFGYIFVDDNTIPEIVLEGSDEATGCILLSYDWKKNGVSELQTNRLYFTYIERKNLLNNSDGHMGYYFDYIYSLNHGAWEMVDEGEYYVEDNSQMWDDEDLLYHWNGEELSKEKYEKKLEAVYPSSESKSTNNIYSYDDMINILEKASESGENFAKSTKTVLEGTQAGKHYFEDTTDVHQYELVVEDVNWHEAEQRCRNMGGHLVRINSAEEYSSIKNLLKKNGQTNLVIWLGAMYDESDYHYHWYNNGKFSQDCLDIDSLYRNCWYEGEPSFYGEDSQGNYEEEHYVDMFYLESKGDYVWNDVPEDISRYYSGRIAYICEYE